MKLNLNLIAAVLTASALAAWGGEPVYSSNTHAMVKVLSSDTHTIIASPWMFYMPSEQSTRSLPIDHLVRPTNLTLGDYVLAHLPNTEGTKSYAAWRLVRTDELIPGAPDREDGQQRPDSDYCWKWEPVMTASQPSVGEVGRFETDGNGRCRTDVWEPDGIENLTANRGYGVWLLRQNPTEKVNGVDASKPFYLYGQWTTGGAEVAIPSGGTLKKPVCVMLANPDCTKSTDVNAITWPNDVDPNDVLILTTDKKTTLYCYRRKVDGAFKWGYTQTAKVNKNAGKFNADGTPKAPRWVAQSVFTPAPEVPAGTGFWYRRHVSTGFTFTWPGPSTASNANE